MLALVLAALTGCKIELRAPVDATILSVNHDYEYYNGTYICKDEATCEIDVVDLTFDETFTARTSNGESLKFDHWKAGDQHLCGNTKLPCHLSTADFEGSDFLMNVLRSDEVFVLEPVFTSPYDKSLPQITMKGEWNYVQRWGGCKASGRIEHKFRPNSNGDERMPLGGGLVSTYRLERYYFPDSTFITSVEPCVFVDPSEFYIGGGISVADMPREPFNEFQWQKYLNVIFEAEIVFQVLDENTYRISRDRDGEWDTYTYTRVPSDKQ